MLSPFRLQMLLVSLIKFRQMAASLPERTPEIWWGGGRGSRPQRLPCVLLRAGPGSGDISRLGSVARTAVGQLCRPLEVEHLRPGTWLVLGPVDKTNREPSSSSAWEASLPRAAVAPATAGQRPTGAPGPGRRWAGFADVTEGVYTARPAERGRGPARAGQPGGQGWTDFRAGASSGRGQRSQRSLASRSGVGGWRPQASVEGDPEASGGLFLPPVPSRAPCRAGRRQRSGSPPLTTGMCSLLSGLPSRR